MVEITWQGQPLTVQRLVLARSASDQLTKAFQDAAEHHDLPVTDERDEPLAGDLWVGEQPIRGWGPLPYDATGWVRWADAYLALAQLRGGRRSFDAAPLLVTHGRR